MAKNSTNRATLIYNIPLNYRFFLQKIMSSFLSYLNSGLFDSSSFLMYPIEGKYISNKTMNSGIYHEKQVLLNCGLHMLNNLFQDPQAFSKVSPSYFNILSLWYTSYVCHFNCLFNYRMSWTTSGKS